MTAIAFPQLLQTIREAERAYHKIIILAGPSGSGKSHLLKRISIQLALPLVNLSLLLSERLLSQTRRQRTLRAEQETIEILDTHLESGICIDNTELLFDSALRLNPLRFFLEASRNRLMVASWNGTFDGSELRFGKPGHPDFFTQSVSACRVVTVDREKLQLYDHS